MIKNKGTSKNRKTINHKNATFNLELDGFSIHTFPLSRQLTQSEYYALKKNLYSDYPGIYKTDSKGEDGAAYIFHHCNAFNRYGVRICLMKCCFVDQEDSTPYEEPHTHRNHPGERAALFMLISLLAVGAQFLSRGPNVPAVPGY